jgi:hypothetical protein
MATDPERQIEKLLRAAAKKRRDEAGAPFELHPASRRLLQGEVARRYRQLPSESASLIAALVRFWPRLAWTIGIFLVLGFAAWIVLPHGTRPQGGDLAMNRAAPPQAGEAKDRHAPQAQDSPGLAAPAPAGTVAPAALSEKRAMSPEAAAAPALAFGASSIARVDSPRQVDSDSLTKAPARPAEAPLMLSQADSTEGSVKALAKAETGASAQQFSKVRMENDNPQVTGLPYPNTVRQKFLGVSEFAGKGTRSSALSAEPVLRSFVVEQSGRALRVTDADGSVYAGSIQAVPTRALRIGAQQSPSARTAAQPTAAPENFSTEKLKDAVSIQSYYSFQVAGTNRSLRQKVVFSGNLVPFTNNPSITTTNSLLGIAPGKTGDVPAPAQFTPLLHSQISGILQVGTQQEIEIKALPIKR